MSDKLMHAISFEDKLRSGYYTRIGFSKSRFGAIERSLISQQVKEKFVGTFNEIQAEIDKKIGEAKENHEKRLIEYYEKEKQLLDEFKRDMIENSGLTNHPKVEECYKLAWEFGHEEGLQSVASFFDKLDELLKP